MQHPGGDTDGDGRRLLARYFGDADRSGHPREIALGLAELRLDSPTGPVVGTADLVASGGAGTYRTATATVTAPDEGSHKLYVVVAARQGNYSEALGYYDRAVRLGSETADPPGALAGPNC